MKLFACFAALLVKIAFTNLAKAKGTSDCDLICDAKDFSRPVCGSDGKTYQSKCILRLKKCTSGKKLFVEYNGACRAPPSCTEERRRVFKSIRDRHLLSVGIFIPECAADGTYSEIQCSQNKRLCWCVDKYGAEIEDTRVTAKRPNCRSRRLRNNPSPTNERYARILKGCSNDNRVNFNKKVMASFKKEMGRLSGTRGKLNSKGIAEWKMRTLDTDNNNFLNHRELRGLIRRLKRAYPPRKCGKTFFFYCDQNQNYVISKKEWLTCLGIQEVQGWVYNESFAFPASDRAQCFSQQTRAKAEQIKNPSTTVFVPLCNKDGTYKTVQCEKVSKYCWCVHPTTGRNIPNTSVQNARPDCSKPSRKVRPMRAPVYVTIKPLTRPTQVKTEKVSTREVKKVKECDETTWQRFREELVKMMRKELESLTNARTAGNSTRRSQSRNLFRALSSRLSDFMITSWKFSQLDTDRDRLLRSDELFSSQMKKVFGLIRRGRKCSKKLAILCDSDYNGGLSLEEWRRCLARRNTSRGFLGR